MQRYPVLILFLSFPLFAAQNLPDSAKPQRRDVLPAAPSDVKPRDTDVPTAVPRDAKPRDTDVPTAVPRDAKPAAGVEITAEQWARPRHGAGIVQLPGVGALVEAVGRDAAARLVIRFASGDEGVLWAEELRSWLVALGLPSARIALEPGPVQADALRLELRPPR